MVDLQPQYTYTTKSPSSTRRKITDLSGHTMGYTIRRDILKPLKVAKEFKPYCLCGARATDWFRTLKLAERRWFDAHIREAEKQGSLF